MNSYDEKHKLYEECMKKARKEGKFKIVCDNRASAMRQRMKFYNFFKFLDKIVNQNDIRDINEYQWAANLLEMRKRINFRCHKIGVLELIWESADYESNLLKNDLETEEIHKKVTLDDLRDELAPVQLQETIKRADRMGDGFLTERKKNGDLWEED